MARRTSGARSTGCTVTGETGWVLGPDVGGDEIFPMLGELANSSQGLRLSTKRSSVLRLAVTSTPLLNRFEKLSTARRLSPARRLGRARPPVRRAQQLKSGVCLSLVCGVLRRHCYRVDWDRGIADVDSGHVDRKRSSWRNIVEHTLGEVVTHLTVVANSRDSALTDVDGVLVEGSFEAVEYFWRMIG